MTIPIIFVLDSSGSMAGEKIEAINEAMSELKTIFDSLSESAMVRVGIISFSIGCRWHTDGLIDINKLKFNPLAAYGLTELGSAIKEISERLTKKDLLSGIEGKISKPIIVFMSDGIPTDNWEEILQKAETINVWFRTATRISIGIGQDFDGHVLIRLERVYEDLDSDTIYRSFSNLLRATNSREIRKYLELVFKHSVLYGYSNLLEDATVKAERIKNNVKSSLVLDNMFRNEGRDKMPTMGRMDLPKRKIIPIVLILDISGNNPEYTASLNDAMSCFEKDLRSSFCTPEYEPIISVITYGSTSEIIANAVHVEDFFWDPLLSGGLSDLGQGLKNIEIVINNTYRRNKEELHNYDFVANPIIALVARNYPTDNYEKELNSLKTKQWFLKANRVAFFKGILLLIIPVCLLILQEV